MFWTFTLCWMMSGRAECTEMPYHFRTATGCAIGAYWWQYSHGLRAESASCDLN